LVNVNQGASQWQTNLIGYDALHSFGSASFYAQKMYSNNRGDRVLPVELRVARSEDAAASATPEMPPAKGRIGVGTWMTRSEFKDMKVTVGDKVVYSVDPTKPAKDWRLGNGDWTWDGDVLRQSSEEENCRALVGDIDWTDYTYTLRARKLSGAEGFLILFHANNDNNWIWWNVGGWGNTRSAIQRGQNGGDRELGRQQNITVEPNRWYDIKIEVEGRQIRCYLDGELVAERTDAPPQAAAPPAPMYATALRDDATGDVILRLVNTQVNPTRIEIDMEGAKSIGKEGTAGVLSGEPADVNTVSTPEKVAPRTVSITHAGPRFVYESPPYSVSVLRLKAE
jgi:alpha-L-arabinofuranosidase